MIRALRAGGSVLLGLAFERLGWGAPPSSTRKKPAADDSKTAPTIVYEIHFEGLRSPSGRIDEVTLGDSAMIAAGVLTGERFPLDGLDDLFPDAPSVAVIVDPPAGTARARVLAQKLQTSLVDTGSPPGGVRILGGTDEDLAAAGYQIARAGKGPYCHGVVPSPGFGPPIDIAGVGRVSLARPTMSPKTKQLAVVASASARGARMGPFVIDAMLGMIDEKSRERSLRDPEYGAKILASPQVGRRVAFVVGDLIEVPFSDAVKGAAGDTPEGDSSIWRADELLAGSNLFAVERIAHRILSNTRKAHDLGDVPPHPVLEAAETLGLAGSGFSTIEWRKGAL